MNDTAEPFRLFSTLLVFNLLHCISIRPPVQTNQVEEWNLCTSQERNACYLSQSQIRTALNTTLPAATDRPFCHGDEVLMFRERPVNTWLGPYLGVIQKEKMLMLDTRGRRIRPQSIK